MPVGFQFIEQVAALLSETEPRQTSDIVAAIRNRTPRAIRYALTALVEAGRARRQGFVYFACPDIMVDVVDVATGNTISSGVPLRSCFPDDAESYFIACKCLATELMATIGGGAAPLLQIKCAAQPAEAEAA
jgi:hypothetical protein